MIDDAVRHELDPMPRDETYNDDGSGSAFGEFGEMAFMTLAAARAENLSDRDIVSQLYALVDNFSASDERVLEYGDRMLLDGPAKRPLMPGEC